MPGMGHKPQIVVQERPRRKFVTKRRQRKTSTTAVGANDEPDEKKSTPSQNSSTNANNGSAQENHSSNGNNTSNGSGATNGTGTGIVQDDSLGSIGSVKSVKSYHEPNQIENDEESHRYNSTDHYNNLYHSAPGVPPSNNANTQARVQNGESQGDVSKVQQSFSTMSILDNASSETMEPMDTMATMATYGTVGSRMDQRP